MLRRFSPITYDLRSINQIYPDLALHDYIILLIDSFLVVYLSKLKV